MPIQSRSGNTVKKIFSLILLLTIVAAACAAPKSEPAASITLTFACPNSDLTVYQDAAKTFHQANPSTQVRVIPLDQIVSFPLEDETDTLGPVRQLASQADAFIWSTDAVEGGPPGLVLDLTTFVEADGEPTEDDFLTDLWDHFQWQGRTWGLPIGVDPLVLLYDPTAFEAAGVKPPAPGWSWEELFSAAQQLTQREGEQVTRYGFADLGLGSVRSAVEARGEQLVDDSVEPLVSTLDDPRTTAAVKWYTNLALAHHAMPNPADEEFVDSLNIVRQGKAAMSVNPGQLWVDGAHDDELAVAPLPGKSPVWLNGAFISAGAAHPEATWRWLEFLTREVAPPRWLPARRSLISGSPYAAAAGEEALAVFRYAAEHALPPMHPAAVEELLRQAVERVFEGKEAVDALDEAQRQALALVAPVTSESFAVPSPAPEEANVETITFVAFPYQEYTALAEAFHEAHPEIEVIVRDATSFDYHGGTPVRMIEASGADCFRSTGIASITPEIQQLVLNLQPLADTDSGFPLDDYLSWTLESVHYGGDLWGLPAGVSVDVLWYNRTLFDEANLPYPEDNWSWHDIFLTAHKLSGKKDGSQRYGFIIWPDIRVVPLLEAIGAPLVDQSTPLPAFRFDAPETAAAIRQLTSLVQDEVVPIPGQSKEQASQNLYDLIWANRIGMWTGNVMVFDKQDNDFKPAHLPEPSKCHGFRSSAAYYITAETPNPEACWEWLRFLSDRIPATGLLPPRRSLLTSNAFREQVGADAQAVYLEALECEEWGLLLGQENLPPYASRAITWLDQALRGILWHGADAQVELSEAQRKAEAYLECLRQRDDPEDEASAEACFEQVDAQ